MVANWSESITELQYEAIDSHTYITNCLLCVVMVCHYQLSIVMEDGWNKAPILLIISISIFAMLISQRICSTAYLVFTERRSLFRMDIVIDTCTVVNNSFMELKLYYFAYYDEIARISFSSKQCVTLQERKLASTSSHCLMRSRDFHL